MAHSIEHLLHYLVGAGGLSRRWPEVVVATLMLLPWPMALSISRAASLRRMVIAWMACVYVYSRLIQDVAIFGPIVCAVSFLAWWAHRRAAAPTNEADAADARIPAEAGGGSLTRWLRPAITLAGVYVSAYQADSGVSAWIVCFALIWLLLDLTHSAEIGRAARSPGMDTLATALIAVPLGWALDGLRVDRFLPMALIGTAGWVACCFELWRTQAGRTTKQVADQAARPRWTSRAFTVGCWSMVGLLLSIDCIEAYFRYVYDESDAIPTIKTARSWWKRHVTYNSWGFRGPEPEPLDRFDDHFRVALLGDSFGFGPGIEDDADLLHSQLRRALQARLGPDQPVTVLNISLSGMTTKDEWNIFNNYSARIRPHAVVHLYMLNDINDGTMFIAIQHPKLAPWRSLMAASYSLEFVIWRVYDRWFRDNRDEPFRELQHFQDDAVFANHAEHVKQLAGAIADSGAVHVVVVFPFLGTDRHWDVQRFALDRIEGLLDDLNIPHVAAEDCFDVKDRQFIVNPFDPHPNADAYAAVVPAVAELIEREWKRRQADTGEPPVDSVGAVPP